MTISYHQVLLCYSGLAQDFHSSIHPSTYGSIKLLCSGVGLAASAAAPSTPVKFFRGRPCRCRGGANILGPSMPAPAIWIESRIPVKSSSTSCEGTILLRMPFRLLSDPSPLALESGLQPRAQPQDGRRISPFLPLEPHDYKLSSAAVEDSFS